MAKLIQLIGTSGTGKSTILNPLADLIKQDGFRVAVYTEPGPFKAEIKAYRLRKGKSDWVEAAMFAADRTVSYLRDREPRRAESDLVFLSDRGFLDSLVYQGLSGGVDLGALRKMNSAVPLPDLAILLTVNGQTGYERSLERHRRTGEPLSKNESPERIRLFTSYYQMLPVYYPEINLKEINTTSLTIEQTTRRAYEMIMESLK